MLVNNVTSTVFTDLAARYSYIHLILAHESLIFNHILDTPDINSDLEPLLMN